MQFKETQVFFPTCLRSVSTRCKIDCSNDFIMELATITVFEGNIFGLHQFWEYFIIMSLFWISQAITWSLQDPICFDLLGDCFYILKLINIQFISPKKKVKI